MMQLELGGRRWPLVAGESVIGSSSAAAVRLEQPGILGRHALVHATPAGAAIRRAAPEAEIAVNGVALTADPVPLLHGDRVRIGTVELVVVDEARMGATEVADATALREATAAAPAARLVSMTDGREYQAGSAPLTFGRDAGCDVVIESNKVSRQHATLTGTPAGFVLEDTSANGVLVNGTRIEGRRTLVRGDVLRIGPAEFRFHVDAASGTPSPPPGAVHRLYDTAHGIPSMVPSFPSRTTAAPPLATVLVRTGGLRGQRLPIRTPVVNIGRADYNDLVFGEESVSASHAKLQRREDVWVLTDLGSTNGTFVDGDQIRGEVPVMPGSTLRFGDVAVLFDPSDSRGPQVPGGGTRVVGAVPIPDTPRMPASRAPAPSATGRGVVTPPSRPGPPARMLVFLVVLAAVAALVAFYFFGR